jgi:hypothetical protein
VTYIATLTRIIKLADGMEPKSFIEIERIFRKDDLPEHILADHGQTISAAEVFPSKEKIYLYVESIKGKCSILTLEEYGDLGLTSEINFFSRAGFDFERKLIVPDPATWKRDCVCGQPTNPDLQYVACTKCARWFHYECVQSKIINEHFMCDHCFSHPY